MSAFILKIIALVSMTCDHISYVIYRKVSYLNYIGRFAFPIFAFQISEGYTHTRSLMKYSLRLLVFALLSQIPFSLYLSRLTNGYTLNVFFTLFLGLMALLIFDKFSKIECKSKFLHYSNIVIGIICVICLAVIAQVTNCDYGAYGISIIFIFYLLKDHKVLMNLAFIATTFVYYFDRLTSSSNFNIYLISFICTCLSIVIIDLYNGKKGLNIKYLLYIFYPVHLLLFYYLTFVLW